VQEQVAVLLELMEADERIRSLRRRVEAQATEKQRKQMEAELVANALAQEKARLVAAEKRHRDALGEIEICRKHKHESETKLQAVKTNEEYRALLKEIAAADDKVKRFEETILQTIEEEEAARRTIATVAEELKQKEAVAATEVARYDTDLAAARVDQQGLLVKRGELVSGLTAAVRAKYERLWSAKGDTAIVPVRQGSCGGCHYNLPPQTVNEVRSGRRLMLCEGCGRILVWPQV
jgi:predicted  nucleic acid-binding Zn-ribbon protein